MALQDLLHCGVARDANQWHSSLRNVKNNKYYNQGPDFDDMSSFFPCEIDDAIQYINLGYGAQAPKIVIL